MNDVVIFDGSSGLSSDNQGPFTPVTAESKELRLPEFSAIENDGRVFFRASDLITTIYKELDDDALPKSYLVLAFTVEEINYVTWGIFRNVGRIQAELLNSNNDAIHRFVITFLAHQIECSTEVGSRISVTARFPSEFFDPADGVNIVGEWKGRWVPC